MASIAKARARAVVFGITVACVAHMTLAKTPTTRRPPPVQAAVWDKEPTSFLGFELGKPVSSDTPTCPTDVRELAETRTTCLKAGNQIRDVWWGPDLGMPYSDYILLQDGNVASVTLNTPADNYDALKRLLITRYGPPTKVSATTVKSMAGAEFPSEESDWDGVNVNIRLYQRFQKIDQSSVSANYKTLMKVFVDGIRAKENAAASKL